MEKEGHISQITQSWRAVPNEDICEWARYDLVNDLPELELD
jgi:hypothetical protein